jgi:general secretion pathway protein B
MSYILDALQRAAQERERAQGLVPGLQTRSLTTEAATHQESAFMRHRWAFLALGLVLAIAAVGFILWRVQPVSEPPALTPPATGSVAAPAPATVAMPAVLSPTAAAPEPISVNPPAALPAALPAAASPAPTKARPVAPLTVAVNSAKSSPAASPTPAPKPNTRAELWPKTSLPLLKDLPEALRAQLPPLSISGVVYSDNPAQRLLLLNGQVLTQGSRAADDLVLDEIHPRSSDFTFRGTRFKLSH